MFVCFYICLEGYALVTLFQGLFVCHFKTAVTKYIHQRNFVMFVSVNMWYRDCVGNTVDGRFIIFSLIDIC